MRINSRNKGIRGERAIIDLLQPIVDKVTKDLGIKPILLQRNTLQSDQGGFDIVGLEWLAIEVKNCSNNQPNQIEAWWNQCCEQAQLYSMDKTPLYPVLFYKRPRLPWRVRCPGYIYDRHCEGKAKHAWRIAVVEISIEDFLSYFYQRCKAELSE